MPFDDVVFTVEGEPYRWREVIAAAERGGEWRSIAEEARAGLACLRRAEATGDALPAGAVEAAGREFRYARDLVSAQSMEAWLARWEMSVRDWTGYLRRALLRERDAERLPEIVAGYPVADADVAPVVRAEAVCSGRLERLARELAGRTAAAAALGVNPPAVTGITARLEQIDASYGQFRASHVTERAVRDWIGGRKLDWVRFDCRVMRFDDPGMASEAAMMLREDGERFTGVYVAARVAPAESRFFLDQLPPAMRDSFLGARTGDLVGPLRVDGAWMLYLVRDKILPSATDPDVRRRAEEGVLTHALQHELDRRVRWLAPR